MTETEFNRLADETIEDIEQRLDELDIDIDYETTGGVLTISFADNSKLIINRQAPLQQIWVATRSGGFHFNYNEAAQCWIKDDDGTELLVALSRYCSDHAGQAVEL